MIWVWGENGPDAGLESALTPAALNDDLLNEEGMDSGKLFETGVSCTDVPYGWDTFMENVVVRERGKDAYKTAGIKSLWS